MSAAYALTLVPSAIAIIVVAVTWFTFRLALKQDRLRRLHDQRAQLYVDLRGFVIRPSLSTSPY